MFGACAFFLVEILSDDRNKALMTKTDIILKVFIAVVATAFSLCSACGLYFTAATMGAYEIWTISLPCFLIFGAAAYLLWRSFTRVGRHKGSERSS